MFDPIPYWYLLPVGIVIATLYTSTGISGANFWAPVFFMWLRLEPRVAFWLALVAMLFGSTGGLIRHARQRTINLYPVKRYLLVTVPLAIAGARLVPLVSTRLLLIYFGVFVSISGWVLLYRWTTRRESEPQSHERINYLFGALGGFSTGLVSVGLGKLILPSCVTHKRISHHAEAVGSVIAVVFITSFIAALARLNPSLIDALRDTRGTIFSIMACVVPGVLLGGQIGPRIARRLPLRAMRLYVALLLVLVGGLALARGIYF